IDLQVSDAGLFEELSSSMSIRYKNTFQHFQANTLRSVAQFVDHFPPALGVRELPTRDVDGDEERCSLKAACLIPKFLLTRYFAQDELIDRHDHACLFS